MTSIRRALTLRLLCILGLMLAGVEVALFLGVRAALTSQFDGTLRARLATLESSTRWDGARVDVEPVSDITPWYQPGPEAEYFEVRMAAADDAPESAIARSPSLGAAALQPPAGAETAIADARLPDGRPGRVAMQVFKPALEEDLEAPGKEAERARAVATTPTLRVTVAMSRRGLDAGLRTIAVALIAASGLMGLGLIVGVRLALGPGLAPLRRISAEVEQIRADTLSMRLSAHDIPDELRPIHARLNELIERLEIAFARERRFASAAAHELRTPVAELRTLFEVSVSRPRTAEDARETIGEALEITTRMESLVQSLLVLARPSTPCEASRLPEVPLGPVLLRALRRFEPRVAAHDGHIVCTGDRECVVRADPAVIESILNNVLANAVEYAEPVPAVTCETQAHGDGSVRIDIANPVRGVTNEDVARFFEPFWRQAESRTGREHLGLGLTVTRALVEGMGGTIQAELVSNETLRVRVVLPGKTTPPAESTGNLAVPDPCSATPTRTPPRTFAGNT